MARALLCQSLMVRSSRSRDLLSLASLPHKDGGILYKNIIKYPRLLLVGNRASCCWNMDVSLPEPPFLKMSGSGYGEVALSVTCRFENMHVTIPLESYGICVIEVVCSFKATASDRCVQSLLYSSSVQRPRGKTMDWVISLDVGPDIPDHLQAQPFPCEEHNRAAFKHYRDKGIFVTSITLLLNAFHLQPRF